MNNYDIFEGEDLKIADKIQQRRLQILIHSCIYYNMDGNVVSDRQYDIWGQELTDLQNKHPEIAHQVRWADAFKGYDGSTGFDLPIDDPWVLDKATKVYERLKH